MPIYTYWCRQCGLEVEEIVKYAERDEFRQHDDCGGSLERDEGLERTNIGEAAYQMKAITAAGDHVPGHFGKDAKRDRKKR